MGTMEIPKPGVASAGAKARFAWVAENLGSHIREYGGTFATEFTVLASQLLAYKLAAHVFGKAGFAEYALVRRSVSLLVPIPVLGLGVGLSRFIGFCDGRGESEVASRYYGAALKCAGGAALLCFIVMNMAQKVFAYLFFGSRDYAYLALPSSLMVLGLCLHTVVCAYSRGHLQVNRANTLQIFNLAVVPILGFFVFGRSLAGILTGVGLTWLVVSILGMLLTPFGAIKESNVEQTKELLRYGIQRVPGDFMLTALFTLPGTFVAHISGIQQAGFVAFGVTVVSTIGAAFAPVGLVLLPKATSMLAGGARRELREHVWEILRATIIASAVFGAAIWIWIPTLIRLYLGPGYEPVVAIVRVLVLGALPYSVYLVVRNLVDAYHKDGVTTAVLAGGLAIFLCGSYFGQQVHAPLQATLVAFILSLFTMAGFSGWECRRVLRDE